MALVVITGLTACTFYVAPVSVTGGAGGPPLSAEEQARHEAERRAQEERERNAQEIADMRLLAIAALGNAMQSFIHDSSTLTEEARQMMRDIFALKQSLEATSDPGEIYDGFHQAQSLLYDAYPIAVSVGAVAPAVVGQHGWQQSWWFISSP